ncbi:hypothetical protein BpHYR1_024951 [Brachionus plicatilis]|uniref:Uncharacterized protein n=1 Tax=Brachionus plicatilis TaxID=10195 RepID=A0A3M7PEY4_BRAPC|nr:hypothetical protein BpHYR1_024951 [Brachionus plicatilis]
MFVVALCDGFICFVYLLKKLPCKIKQKYKQLIYSQTLHFGLKRSINNSFLSQNLEQFKFYEQKLFQLLKYTKRKLIELVPL